VTLDHVTVDHVGDGADGILLEEAAANFAITNCSFSGIPTGSYAISVMAPSFAGIGAGNTFAPSTMIELAGGPIDTTTSWANPGAPIAVTSDFGIDGPNMPTLTLAAGMTFKFADAVGLGVGESAGGVLVIAGTAAARVTLTSLTDLAIPGHWGGVKVWSSGQAQISYADFDYGGNGLADSYSFGNLSLESAAVTSQATVANSTFKDSLGWGIYVACAASGLPGATTTVDSATTYANNALGSKGPGPICP
jgi:hypothetical protein